MDFRDLSPLHSPRTMRQLNTPQVPTRQPSLFQPGGLSPMHISPLGSPVEQPSLPYVQPPTFQPTTFVPSNLPIAGFTMPDPKQTTRHSKRLSARRSRTLIDSHYNPKLNLAQHGVDQTKTGFVGNIEELSKININFRTVLYTTQHVQLVLMSLKAGQDIGVERHHDTDQFFRIETGTGIVEIDGVRRPYEDGTAIQIPQGSQHNLIAITETKLYTLYSPPHHSPDKIEAIKR